MLNAQGNLRSERSFIIEAMVINPIALQYAMDELKSDKTFLKGLIEKNFNWIDRVCSDSLVAPDFKMKLQKLAALKLFFESYKDKMLEDGPSISHWTSMHTLFSCLNLVKENTISEKNDAIDAFLDALFKEGKINVDHAEILQTGDLGQHLQEFKKDSVIGDEISKLLDSPQVNHQMF